MVIQTIVRVSFGVSSSRSFMPRHDASFVARDNCLVTEVQPFPELGMPSTSVPIMMMVLWGICACCVACDEANVCTISIISIFAIPFFIFGDVSSGSCGRLCCILLSSAMSAVETMEDFDEGLLVTLK